MTSWLTLNGDIRQKLTFKGNSGIFARIFNKQWIKIYFFSQQDADHVAGDRARTLIHVTHGNEGIYNPPTLSLPTVLVNIIIVVVYFYPRLRIRHPEIILVVIIVVSEARYKTLHSTNHRKLSQWVGVMDTASSYQSESRGFKSRLVFFFLHTVFVPLSGYCSKVQDNLET